MFAQEAQVQLWLGADETLKQEINAYIKTKLCTSKKGCTSCSACKQIVRSQHPAVLVMHPANDSYAVDQIDELLHKTTFMTDPDETIWCVLLKAQALSLACANRLLKLLEEPPRGWHFILAATHKESLLPTIMSRCITVTHSKHYTAETSALVAALSPQNSCSPEDFFVLLEKTEYTIQKTEQLLHEVIVAWVEHELSADTAELKTEAQKMVRILTHHLDNLPMPGGEKLFWRNIFMAISHTLNF